MEHYIILSIIRYRIINPEEFILQNSNIVGFTCGYFINIIQPKYLPILQQFVRHRKLTQYAMEMA